MVLAEAPASVPAPRGRAFWTTDATNRPVNLMTTDVSVVPRVAHAGLSRDHVVVAVWLGFRDGRQKERAPCQPWSDPAEVHRLLGSTKGR